MSIATYSDLQTSLTRFLRHSQFVPDYDNATQRFERVLNRRLRLRPQMVALTFTTVLGAFTLPSDFLTWRSVEYQGATTPNPNQEMEYVEPQYMKTTLAGNTRNIAIPNIFTIEGSVLTTAPTDDTASRFLLRYWQSIPTLLGAGSNTNWLLMAHSDLYEFGVLTELNLLGRNMDQGTLYKQRRDEILEEVIRFYDLTNHAPSSQVREGTYF
jgi:hypothetical protein